MIGGLSAIRLLRKRPSPLVAEASQGDPRAVSILLTAARSVVHDWARVKTRDPDDAEDVTQLVLVKLFTRLHKFRGDSRLTSWLYRITINEVSGFYKKRESERKKVLSWFESGIGSHVAHQNTDRVDLDRMVAEIREAATSLPPLQASVFRMVDLDGFRPCEVAHELGTTQTNTRSSLSRARKKIRELVRQARRELVEDLSWEGR